MTLQIRHLRLAVLMRSVSSLSRAASELGITQPTASRLLDEIERNIGVAVIERSARGSKLTPTGEAFVAHALQTLASFDALVDPDRWQQRELTLAYAWGGLESTLTDAVRRWHQNLPHGRCRLRQHDDPRRSLESGAVDLALIRGAVDSPMLSSCTLYVENRVVVLPVDSPLISLSSIERSQLQDLEAVVNVDSGTTGELWVGDPPQPQVTEVHGVDEWIVAIASHQQRFGVTPESTMSYYAHPRIVARPSNDLPDIPVCLAWRREDRRTMVQDFIALAKECA
ncbi:LysR family transcriptional regulator [Kocuria sp. SL71]|uniref:LysR family transcriptional regulator n=1 Tax=Kocuria sp. SL71 TaxID=2995151 RepID=UPI002275F930|nr:LysR family transcriptional regulator [Kocuria sp. SL71]MCY1685161.1 LysR family transcriptional regulator [Kocuria sp. SL71]